MKIKKIAIYLILTAFWNAQAGLGTKIHLLIASQAVIGLSSMTIAEHQRRMNEASQLPPLTNEECILAKKMEGVTLIKRIAQATGSKHLALDYVWHIHNNQPPEEVKKNLDAWFNHTEIKDLMFHYYNESGWRDSVDYDNDRQRARKVGFSDSPHGFISFSPDNKWALKNMDALSAVGRQTTCNAMQQIIDKHNLDAIKLPNKSLYVEPHAIHGGSIILVATRFDLETHLAPFEKANPHIEEQLAILEKECRKIGIRLDYGSDNITYHRDENHRLGGYIAIIDTEGLDVDIPQSPRNVVRFYKKWKQQNAPLHATETPLAILICASSL